MDFTNLLISLVSGVAGGNAAGAAMPDKGLGALGNLIAGLIGGGAGAAILPALLGMATQSGGGGTNLLGDIAGGGAGGALLTVVIGLVKNAMAAKS